MIRPILFGIGTIVFLYLSRNSIRNPRAHGFYRFFAFEGILLLVLINHPRWFSNPFSPLQLVSWVLLGASIYFVIHALLLLKKRGGHAPRQDAPENFSFENTVMVVEEGLYRYVRHPMYSSLLFLAWGAFCKQISPLNIGLVALVTVMLIAAAKIEERENINFFGSAYAEYMGRSRLFIPFVL